MNIFIENLLNELCLCDQPNKMYDKPNVCSAQLFEWPNGIFFVHSNIKEPHKTNVQIFCRAAFTAALINRINKKEVSTTRLENIWHYLK